jgi:hypothetical protein
VAITYVQGSALDAQQAVTITPATGNLMVAMLFSQSNSDAPTISDTQTNGWTQFTTSPFHNQGAFTLTAYWAISKNSSSTTITFAAFTTAASIFYGEYSGLSATPADGDNTATGTSDGTTDNIASSTWSTTVDGDLVLGLSVNLTNQDTFTHGTGFTARAASSLIGAAGPFVDAFWEDLVQGAHSASTKVTWTEANADTYALMGGAFKASGAAAASDGSVGMTIFRVRMRQF